MAITQLLLYYVPTFLLGFIILSLSVAISVIGVLWVRRHVPLHKLKAHNDIAGPMFNTLGVIYAVLLAFVVIAVWQNYNEAKSGMTNEVTCYAEMYRDLNGLPDHFRLPTMDALDNYIRAVVTDEWPKMARGERSLQVEALAKQFWTVFTVFEPESENDKIYYAEALTRLNNAVEYRRERLVNSQTGIHPVIWFVLIVGGIITIVFTFFFGSENLLAQLIMTSLLAVVISMILFTIMVLDYPFTGSVGIKPDAFNTILLYLDENTPIGKEVTTK